MPGVDHMLTFLRDIHRHTARELGEERMWPLSMPCYIDDGQNIELAQYGSSNAGRFKTLYREGPESHRQGEVVMHAGDGLHQRAIAVFQPFAVQRFLEFITPVDGDICFRR